ncbi:uncharacterized protein CG5098 [Drosophila grimshawi]|uniref:GH21445 n=1 Tax=Drosophila grimshawi TaxID=7222 RepID=B4J9G8_DROGR|nr:uncharacterized protein CG5098 [Drosophila grimshawi]EDW01449.1 GH21445 [Drosophila grimshawi]
MSNNNHPHGHLSQAAQNPSWNPLQIPSYIPRQPQLAHMSNERPLVRSPLAWHASAQPPPPPPPDAIYNFMSANHKNLDHHHQMNPLLAPPYTGTLPFDSMDLSLQSSRSAAPALSKTGQQQQQQQSQQQQQQQQSSHLHAPHNYPTIHNLTTNTPAGAQQGHLPGMPASASPASAASKYLNANGAADCESLLPPPPSTPPNNNNHNNNNNSSSSVNTNSSSSNNNVPPSHYMQNRDENFKLTQLKSMQKNTELSSKECSYAAGAAGKLAAHSMQQQQQQHAKKPSPLRNYHQQQQQQQPYNMTPPKYNGPQTPPTPQSPLDYNQLHLHHQLHASVGSYAPHQPQQQQQHQQLMQQEQQQQQQQHQQHLHYAPPPPTHHNQHLAPPPPPPSHMTSAQFQQQQQQQLRQHQPPPPPQQQQQRQTSPQQTHTAQMHSRNTQLTNLDMLSKHKPDEEQPQSTHEEPQPIITDLSTSAAYRSTNAEDKQLVEAPESPYMTTSNEESLESNSNSSNSRKRRKRKASQVMRLTPSDNVKRQRTPSPLSNSCSPKHSPKNGEFQPFAARKEQQQQPQPQQQPQQEHEHELPQENGRAATPTISAAATENSNSSTLYNDTTTDNPKTKKQRQALLQRNLTEQQHLQCQQIADEQLPAATNASNEPTLPPPSPQSNSSSSSSSSSSAATHSSHASEPPSGKVEQQEQQQQQQVDNNKAITDTPASPALVEQGDIDARPAVSVHDDEDETASPADKQSPLPAATAPKITAPTAAATAADAVDAATVDPCHFNEVEDKLEKMFAGIEDEPAEQAADTARAEHDLSAHLLLDNEKAVEQTKAAAASTPPAPSTPPMAPTPEVRPIATKAAMKSTLPSPIHSPTPTAAAETPIKLQQSPIPTVAPASAIVASTAASAKVVPRTPPTRCLPPRRLSMGMDPSLLRFTIEDQQKAKKTPQRKRQPPPPPTEVEIVQLDSDDDKPSTSAAAAAALAARKLSETAAAAAAVAASVAVKTQPSSKANTKKPKNKKNAPKGKKPAGKNGAKQNGNKKGGAGGARKNFSTDEDSTPAPNGVAAPPDLRFKSPFILIKPDGTISIKNTHSAEDVNEKQTKKKQTKAPHERKNLRGMHSSTLSNRYDADTTDSSWICVFCKCGPHKLGLGDLFGPYLVSIDCEEYRTAVQVPAGSNDIDGLFVSKRKRADMVKLQERNLPVVPATLANIMQAPKITMHKRKRKQTHDSVYSCSDDPNESQCSSQDPLDCSHETKFVETFRGMSKTSEHGYEIWMHEDCAVWANDIQLIGAHVNGLDAAVWDSTRYQCVHCAQSGANVCCFQRACKAAAHVPCARVASWSLSEQDRKVYCQLHAPQKAKEETAPIAGAVATATTTMSAISVEQTAVPPPVFNINSLP